MSGKALLIGLASVGALGGLGLALLLWSTRTPGTSFRGELAPLTPGEAATATRLRAHIETIAASERNTRTPAALERAAAYLEACLTELGYAVESQRYEADGQFVRNLSVTIPPRPGAEGGPTVVVGAHYDSYPGSPGANDNASGTAALLELARRLADLRGATPVGLRLAFFTNEEPPHFHTPAMGSYQYALDLAQRGERVLAMYSLETLGYYSSEPRSQRYPPPLRPFYPGQGDFVAFVGMTPSRRLVQEAVRSFREGARFPSEGGSAPGFIPGIDWSDHWSFERLNYPAIMITDTAVFRYPYYHTPEDTPDKVDVDKLARVVGGIESLVRRKVRAEERRRPMSVTDRCACGAIPQERAPRPLVDRRDSAASAGSRSRPPPEIHRCRLSSPPPRPRTKLSTLTSPVFRTPMRLKARPRS